MTAAYNSARGHKHVTKKQALSSSYWFVADDPRAKTRFFVIQGSNNIDHWKINLQFDPVTFEDPSLGLKASVSAMIAWLKPVLTNYSLCWNPIFRGAHIRVFNGLPSLIGLLTWRMTQTWFVRSNMYWLSNTLCLIWRVWEGWKLQGRLWCCIYCVILPRSSWSRRTNNQLRLLCHVAKLLGDDSACLQHITAAYYYIFSGLFLRHLSTVSSDSSIRIPLALLILEFQGCRTIKHVKISAFTLVTLTILQLLTIESASSFQRTSSIFQELSCHLMSSDVMQVHRGFYEAAKILYDQYLPLVEEHLASDPFAKIVFTVSRQSLACIAMIPRMLWCHLWNSECVEIIVLWPSW